MKKENPYDQKYAGEEYYWGKKPSAMCDRVIEIIRPCSEFHPKLLDLGCGEGRNAIYFAQHGFEVVGLDLFLPGLEKMRRYAEEVGVHVETIQGDIVTYEPANAYDVIFSTGTLHYLPPGVRSQHFQQYKDATSPEGIHALSVLVTKPFIPRAPDAEETAFLYKSGELMSHYWDWEILHCAEEIFACPAVFPINMLSTGSWPGGIATSNKQHGLPPLCLLRMVTVTPNTQPGRLTARKE